MTKEDKLAEGLTELLSDMSKKKSYYTWPEEAKEIADWLEENVEIYIPEWAVGDNKIYYQLGKTKYRIKEAKP